MLIITADDYGKTVEATDRILQCFRNRSITSASAMVFMEDSERAAALARDSGLEVGLHLNLTDPYTGHGVADNIREPQVRVSRYLNRHRFAEALFNPLLSKAFRFSVETQWAEFERLYGRPPDFVNGHRHMHLCANVLRPRLLPRKSRIRGPFTIAAGEKGRVNRWYRSVVARRVRKAFITPDCLYTIEPIADTDRLRTIAREALARNVELEVHPEHVEQQQFLLGSTFHSLLGDAELHGFRQLNGQ
jgi:chitin disaccharide deacetylase